LALLLQLTSEEERPPPNPKVKSFDLGDAVDEDLERPRDGRGELYLRLTAPRLGHPS